VGGQQKVDTQLPMSSPGNGQVATHSRQIGLNGGCLSAKNMVQGSLES